MKNISIGMPTIPVDIWLVEIIPIKAPISIMVKPPKVVNKIYIAKYYELIPIIKNIATFIISEIKKDIKILPVKNSKGDTPESISVLRVFFSFSSAMSIATTKLDTITRFMPVHIIKISIFTKCPSKVLSPTNLE